MAGERTAQQELMEARRLLGKMSGVCRQTITYFGGISVLDEQKVRRRLQSVVREADRFLGEEKQ
jgi:hypothetical protein